MNSQKRGRPSQSPPSGPKSRQRVTTPSPSRLVRRDSSPHTVTLETEQHMPNGMYHIEEVMLLDPDTNALEISDYHTLSRQNILRLHGPLGGTPAQRIIHHVQIGTMTGLKDQVNSPFPSNLNRYGMRSSTLELSWNPSGQGKEWKWSGPNSRGNSPAPANRKVSPNTARRALMELETAANGIQQVQDYSPPRPRSSSPRKYYLYHVNKPGA